MGLNQIGLKAIKTLICDAKKLKPWYKSWLVGWPAGWAGLDWAGLDWTGPGRAGTRFVASLFGVFVFFIVKHVVFVFVFLFLPP